MTVHEPWGEMKEVFLGAFELSGDERSRFLRDSCEGKPRLREQVDDMLAAHESAHVFFDPGAGRLGGLLEVALGGNAVAEGDRVGGYRILRVIASGGMGVVYEAEQDNPRRRVALKLMRLQAGTRSLRRRFERAPVGRRAAETRCDRPRAAPVRHVSRNTSRPGSGHPRHRRRQPPGSSPIRSRAA